MSTSIAIIDNGGANIASVRFALERLGLAARLTAEAGELQSASHVILPGVGAAGDAMRRLQSLALVDVIRGLTQPVLGICLGMQLLFESSAEDDTEGLGIIPGRVAQIPASPDRPVPHMGWNQLRRRATSPLLDGVEDGDYVYFVHSYAAPVNSATLAVCDYGDEFAALVRKDNFYGMQFHPERSARVGATLLGNFARLERCA
jgi:glutamine amidotransferase